MNLEILFLKDEDALPIPTSVELRSAFALRSSPAPLLS